MKPPKFINEWYACCAAQIGTTALSNSVAYVDIRSSLKSAIAAILMQVTF